MKFRSLLNTTTQLDNVPIITGHSMGPKAEEVINQNTIEQMSTVTVIGRQGGGKTSFMSAFAHKLHLVGQRLGAHYQVVRVGGDEIPKLESYLQSLPKVNIILLIDDATFVTSGMSGKDLNQLKYALTTIRHWAAGGGIKVIVMYAIHYSKGLDLFLRDTTYKVLLNVGPQDAKYLSDVVGESPKDGLVQELVERRSFMVKHGFYAIKNVARVKGNILKYQLDNPWRFGLFCGAKNLFFVYPSPMYDDDKNTDYVTCAECDPEKKKPRLDPTSLMDEIVQAFGTNRANQAMRYWLASRGYTDINFPPLKQLKSIMDDKSKKYRINLDGVLEQVRYGDGRSHGISRHNARELNDKINSMPRYKSPV